LKSLRSLHAMHDESGSTGLFANFAFENANGRRSSRA
jgi:hypothetical protein